MPLIFFGPTHKEHLQFLTTVETEIVVEFARISMQFIKEGANPKVYQAAGKKLGVPGETVEHGVQGLMFLLTESSKLMISELDFHDSIVILGFPDELNSSLLDLYLTNRHAVRELLDRMSMKLPQYQNMKWRLDAQVASRTLKRQVEPTVVIQLETVGAEDVAKTILMQTDPVTLGHITNQLEAALKTVKTSHFRKVTRAVK